MIIWTYQMCIKFKYYVRKHNVFEQFIINIILKLKFLCHYWNNLNKHKSVNVVIKLLLYFRLRLIISPNINVIKTDESKNNYVAIICIHVHRYFLTKIQYTNIITFKI